MALPSYTIRALENYSYSMLLTIGRHRLPSWINIIQPSNLFNGRGGEGRISLFLQLSALLLSLPNSPLVTPHTHTHL